MKPNRIALALVLAGLAAPAFAEKCVGSCDFNDEPLVVKGDKKQTGAEQPAASNGLATPMKSSVPMLTPLDARGGVAAEPSRQSAAHFGGGAGAGKVSIQDLHIPTVPTSSKPKEIVVVGSKQAPLSHVMKAAPMR